MESAIIVAKTKDGVIGNDGDIPWHIPIDLARFQDITENHTVIMGRKTYESIGGPLKNRRNIVISTTMNKSEHYDLAKSFEDACEMASGDDKVFFIGGQKVYEQALDLVDKIHLTVVDGEYEGDTYFPEVAIKDNWTPVNWKNEADHTYFLVERQG